MRIGIAFKKTSEHASTWDKIQIKMIKWWTKSEYYHVEFFTQDHWISANTDGIEILSLKKLKSNYDYFFIEVNMSRRNADILRRYMLEQNGKKYDWVGIWMSQFLNIGANRRDKWFCSEIVTKLLQVSLIEEFLGIEPHMTDPGGVFNILNSIKDKKYISFKGSVEK
jgi:hypothetical protein